MKKRTGRILAMLLAVGLAFSNPLQIYATELGEAEYIEETQSDSTMEEMAEGQEAADPAAGGEADQNQDGAGVTDTSTTMDTSAATDASATETPAAAETPDATDTPVVTEDAAGSTTENENDSTADETVCICETLCTEEVSNPECPVCSENITLCEVRPEEEIPDDEIQDEAVEPTAKVPTVAFHGKIEMAADQKLEAGAYLFTLKQLDGTGTDAFVPMTAQNDENGSFYFTEIPYQEAGTFRYAVEAAKQNEEDTGSLKEKTTEVCVTVEETDEGLTVSVDPEEIVFSLEENVKDENEDHKKIPQGQWTADADGVSVKATIISGGFADGISPELAVKTLPLDGSEAEAVKAYFGGREILGSLLFDISFEADGTEVEPLESSTIKVELSFGENPQPLGVDQADENASVSRSVLHVVDGEAQPVADGNVETNGDGYVVAVSFIADSFSPYAIVAVLSGTSAIAVGESGGEVDLLEIADLTKLNATDNLTVNRDGSIHLDFSYTIKAEKIDEAMAADRWVYDLSDFVNKYPEIAQVKNASGDIRDAGNKPVGKYWIADNKVYLELSQEVKETYKENVNGTFSLDLQLSTDGTKEKKESRFELPGIAEGKVITVTYSQKDLGTNKEVARSKTGSDYNGKTVQLYDNGKGGYDVWYRLQITMDREYTSVVLKDTLGPYQELDMDSFQYSTISMTDGFDEISKNCIKTSGTTEKGTSFELDFAGALQSLSEKIEEGTTYYIRYRVRVSQANLGRLLTNNATWELEGLLVPGGETTLTPDTRTYALDKTYQMNADRSITYTVTVGDSSTDLGDLAGYTVYDYMSPNQTVRGGKDGVTMNPHDIAGKFEKNPEDPRSGSDEIYAFRFKFGSYDELKGKKGPVIFTYTVELDPNSSVATENTAKLTDPDGNEKARKEVKVGVGVGIDKTFKSNSWDLDKNEFTWKIIVIIPDEYKKNGVENVTVKEEGGTYYYGSQSNDKRNLVFHWDADHVRVVYKDDEASVPSRYYQIESGGVRFTQPLKKDVVIYVTVTLQPGDEIVNDRGDAFHTENTASVYVDGRLEADDTSDRDYIPEDVSMFKHGTYDPATKQFTWTVTINQNRIAVPDADGIWFEDILPDGMEFVGWEDQQGLHPGCVSVSVNGTNTASYFASVTVSGNQIGRGDIGKNGKDHYTLSENQVIVKYMTKLTDTAFTGSRDYKNIARIYKTESDETPLAEDEETLTVSQNVVSKIDEGVFDNDQIQYLVEVNPNGEVLNEVDHTITLEDVDFDKSMVTLTEGSISVLNWDETPYEGSVEFIYSADGFSLVLPDETPLKIRFRVTVNNISDGERTFENKVSLAGKTSYYAQVQEKHVVSTHGATVAGQSGTFKLIKRDSAGELPLQGAVFQLSEALLKEESGYRAEWTPVQKGTGSVVGYFSDEDGEVSFSGLKTVDSYAVYKYEEKAAPEGYQLPADSVGYFILYQTVTGKQEETAENQRKADALARSFEKANGVEAKTVLVRPEGSYIYVYNTKQPDEVVEKTVTKVWKDNENQDGIRPQSIQVQLYADTKPSGAPVTLNEANGWTYTWTDLPKKADGKEIVYTVQEVGEAAGYTTSYSGDTFTITNTHTPATVEKAVTKVWSDGNNRDGLRPGSISVQLFADGVAYGAVVELNAANEWTYTWTGLAEKAAGKAITYTVKELGKITGYTTVYDQATLTITNTHTPETVKKTVTKVWADNDDQDGLRSDIEGIHVQLLADGTPYDVVELTAKDGWTYTWTDLPKNKNGQEIAYTVQEIGSITGYTTAYDQATLTITNTHTPAVVDKTVTKVWKDDEDQDGIRPEKIEVQLLAGSEPYGAAVELNAESGWTYTWTGLPKNAGGEEITYTVEELGEITGYTTAYDQATLTITNTHTPAVVDKTVTKVWVDNDNQDGIRSEKIEVQLLADGEASGEPVELNAENGWTHTWTDLPKNAGGEVINYTVEELGEITGYTTAYDQATLTITNTHTPETVEKTVTKVWEDNNNQDGIRPEKIEVQLLAGSEASGEPVELNESNQWTYTWTELPKNAGGEEITYTVAEVGEITGYTTAYDQATLTITNTHIPGTVSRTVTKVWADSDDQDGLRPESISVQLLAGGEAYGEPVELNAENGWTHTWENLPKNSNGQEIVYTVREIGEVVGYTTEYSDDTFTITNTHTPAVVSRTVTKVWADSDNQDGLRPGSISVQLFADGEAYGDAVELNAANGWMYTWTDLPEKADGKEIIYTVQEIGEVAGYTTSYSDDTFTITNTHIPTPDPGPGPGPGPDPGPGPGPDPTPTPITFPTPEIPIVTTTPAEGGVLGERIELPEEGVLGERRGVLGVRTGDESPVVGLSMTSLMAAMTAIALVLRKKKEKKN